MIIRLEHVLVELTETLVKKIKKYTQDEGKSEAGGILLGGFIPTENKYIITDASVPNDDDVSGPMFFVRKHMRAQEIINKCWIESNGKINYLGEWHTHGCKNPRPSITDKKLLEMIISDQSNVWSEIFMLILGRNNTFYLGMTNIQNKGQIIAELAGKEL